LISEEIFYHPQQPIDDRLTISQHEQDEVFTDDVRVAMNRYIITVKSIHIILKHGSIIVFLLYDGVTLKSFQIGIRNS